MAEANREVAVRDPDALVTEIERTRENLARTVDQLADRLSPANLAHRAWTRPGSGSSAPRRGWSAGPSPPWPCWACWAST